MTRQVTQQGHPYTILIGIETHLQLMTQSKMFCRCANRFHAEPNTLTCPVCLGEPGALPVLNRESYALAVRAGLALHCDIQNDTRFDRKNYFYPDLPKGYQITQFYYPFARSGHVDIGSKKIRIERIHIEEDSGKLTHQDDLGESWIDYNRAGVPLIEIVTYPDINSADEAHAYLNELRLMMRHLGVSDCEMQEGSLRTDINVNVLIDIDGQTVATPIVEVKNMNSFSQVKICIDKEVERHLHDYYTTGASKENTPKETRGWDDLKQVTVPQRTKEGLADYRYFPEPDLPPFVISQEFIASLPPAERPRDCQKRLHETFKLPDDKVAKLISSGKELVDAFEELMTQGHDPETSINWLLNEVLEALNERHCRLKELKITVSDIGDVIDEIHKKSFAMRVARKLFKTMLDEGLKASQVIERDGMKQLDDDDELINICQSVIQDFDQAAHDYRSGKKAALNGLMGRVMQRTGGKANPGKVRQMLQGILDS